MLLQGVFNGRHLEAWRAFDVSGGERFPMRWILTDSQEQQCVVEIRKAAVGPAAVARAYGIVPA